MGHPIPSLTQTHFILSQAIALTLGTLAEMSLRYSIYEWQSSNNMKFNFGKFKWLQFGVRQNTDTYYNYFGPELNEIFTQSSEVKY